MLLYLPGPLGRDTVSSTVTVPPGVSSGCVRPHLTISLCRKIDVAEPTNTWWLSGRHRFCFVLKGGCHMLSFAELGNSQMNKAPFSAPKSIPSLEVRNSEKGERPRFAFVSNHGWTHKRKGLEQIKITLLRVIFCWILSSTFGSSW